MIRILISLMIILTTATVTATEYKRSDWPGWRDFDKDCEDTREEALVRDAIVVLHTNERCTPTTGVWIDPYTGDIILSANSLDADHIVPLKHAHDHGASKWSEKDRLSFANDMNNIIMVSASANRSKGSRAPHEWLPPKVEYRCTYLEQWVTLKERYKLTVSIEEYRFIELYRSNYCNEK